MLSLLSELSKRQQLYYTVGNRRLYPNMLVKVQVILQYISNSGIGYFVSSPT